MVQLLTSLVFFYEAKVLFEGLAKIAQG